MTCAINDDALARYISGESFPGLVENAALMREVSDARARIKELEHQIKATQAWCEATRIWTRASEQAGNCRTEWALLVDAETALLAAFPEEP